MKGLAVGIAGGGGGAGVQVGAVVKTLPCSAMALVRDVAGIHTGGGIEAARAGLCDLSLECLVCDLTTWV